MTSIGASTHLLSTCDRKLRTNDELGCSPGSSILKKEINSVLQENNLNYGCKNHSSRAGSSYKPGTKQFSPN